MTAKIKPETMLKALYEVDRLVSKGWTPVQAFGMVGNDIQESLLIPAIVGDKNEVHNAHGIVQWRDDRFQNLQSFAKDAGKPWEDFDVQIDFKDFELTKGNEKRAGKLIKAAQTIEDATAAAIASHRPDGFTWDSPKSGHGWANRLDNANQVAQAYADRAKPKTVATVAAAPLPSITAKEFNETAYTTKDIQSALKKAGFDPGPIDGVPGRQTIGAVKAFQEKKGLASDGIVGPQTAALLFPKVNASKIILVPPWMALFETKRGLHEVRNKKELMAFLKAGGTIGDPSVTPWCGDLVETCFAVSLPKEPLPGNPYLARNWLQFGVPQKQPTYGSVLVFWRGSKSGTQGHVGFYNSETATHYNVDGGNQSNMIMTAAVEKSRLLGARWPKTVPLPSTGAIIKKASSATSKNEA